MSGNSCKIVMPARSLYHAGMEAWIDSHCHLDFPELDAERATMVAAARAAGLSHLLIPGVAVVHFPRQARVADTYGFHCAYGLHPWYPHGPDDLDRLEDWLQHPGCVAVGECGLDKLRGPALEQQIALLEAQLELARQRELPVILHVVKAHEPLLRLLRRQPLPAGGVVHAFQGSAELARRYLALGLNLGIGAAFTRPNARRWQAVLARLPLEQLLLETDAPALRPAWVDQGPNRPDYLPAIAEALATLRQQPLADLLRQTRQTTLKCFPRLREQHGS